MKVQSKKDLLILHNCGEVQRRRSELGSCKLSDGLRLSDCVSCVRELVPLVVVELPKNACLNVALISLISKIHTHAVQWRVRQTLN